MTRFWLLTALLILELLELLDLLFGCSPNIPHVHLNAGIQDGSPASQWAFCYPVLPEFGPNSRWFTQHEIMNDRTLIRTLHLVLSVPVIGFIYGPVAHIPPAANFTRFVAVPLVAISGFWLWQKPRLVRWVRRFSYRRQRS